MYCSKRVKRTMIHSGLIKYAYYHFVGLYGHFFFLFFFFFFYFGSETSLLEYIDSVPSCGVRSFKKGLWHSTASSDKALVLELLRVWWLSSPLGPGVVVAVRFPSMGQIDQLENYLYLIGILVIITVCKNDFRWVDMPLKSIWSEWYLFNLPF